MSELEEEHKEKLKEVDGKALKEGVRRRRPSITSFKSTRSPRGLQKGTPRGVYARSCPGL